MRSAEALGHHWGLVFVAIALLWAGSVQDAGALMFIQHVGMFPSMLAVMLLRLDEYTGHGGHAPAAA